MSDTYFFDCNLSFGRLKNPPTNIPLYKEEILGILDKINIKKAMATHTAQQFLGAKDGNVVLVSEIADSNALMPVVTVMPNSADEFLKLDELDKFIYKNNIKMATMFPKTHAYSPSDWQMGEIYSYLEEKNIPLLLSFTEVSSDQIYNILSNHKSLKVIVKDTSFSHDTDVFRLMELFEGFHLETGTYATCGGIDFAAGKFGAHRLIFGSNLPHSAPGAAVAKVACSSLLFEDKIKIAHKNLENLIKEVK